MTTERHEDTSTLICEEAVRDLLALPDGYTYSEAEESVLDCAAAVTEILETEIGGMLEALGYQAPQLAACAVKELAKARGIEPAEALAEVGDILCRQLREEPEREGAPHRPLSRLPAPPAKTRTTIPRSWR
jgi:hypothetical protein